MKLKRWQFLLISTALMLIILAAGTGTYFSLVRQERLEEIRQTEEANEQMINQLRETREQLREASDRLTELETMLLNLQRTYRAVTGADLEAAPLSRSGRQYTATTMPLLSPSGFSPARFERAFKGTGMAGLGEALCLAEAETGVNALVLAAIAAHESGWGTSKLARERNNLAGLGAYRAGMGMTFESRADCIDYLARLLAGRPGTLEQVGGWYAEDPGWARKVAGCMKIIAENAKTWR